MNPPAHFPWGVLLSHSTWILGAAIIFAGISYLEYMRRLDKVGEMRIKKAMINYYLLPGSVLILAGIGFAIKTPLLSAVMVTGAFILLMVLIKTKMNE